MTDTSAAAAQKRAKEQLTAAMASMVTQGNIEAEQAAARKREEKRKAEEDAARKVLVQMLPLGLLTGVHSLTINPQGLCVIQSILLRGIVLIDCTRKQIQAVESCSIHCCLCCSICFQCLWACAGPDTGLVRHCHQLHYVKCSLDCLSECQRCIKSRAAQAVEEAERKAREEAEAKIREEEERKAKEELERKAAEESSSAAGQIRASLAKGDAAATAKLLNSFTVENGPAQRMSYLMEVGTPDTASATWFCCICFHS